MEDQEYEFGDRELKLLEIKLVMDCNKIKFEKEEHCSLVTANARILSTFLDLLKHLSRSSKRGLKKILE